MSGRRRRMGEAMPEDLAAAIDRRVAARIRERRRQIGMTQQQLASIIGVAFQQAYKYEHGISRISTGRLFHIARALRAPIGYFFAAEKPAPPRPAPASRGEHGD